MNIDTKAVEFNVVRKPLVTEDGLKTDREAVVRTDTNEVLGVVSKTYGLLEHQVGLRDALKAVEKLNQGFVLKKLVTSGNGARMYAHIEGTKEYNLGRTERMVGDLIRPVLILQNSIDGSTRFGFRIGAMRLICLNGMTSAVTFSSIFTKHTSGVDFDAILASGSDALHQFEERSIPTWKHMMVTPLNKEFAIQQLTDKKLGIPDMVNKRVIELTREDSTDTLWDLYNKYTYHLTHEYKGSEDRRIFISSAVERVLGGM